MYYGQINIFWFWFLIYSAQGLLLHVFSIITIVQSAHQK